MSLSYPFLGFIGKEDDLSGVAAPGDAGNNVRWSAPF